MTVQCLLFCFFVVFLFSFFLSKRLRSTLIQFNHFTGLKGSGDVSGSSCVAECVSRCVSIYSIK